VFVIAVGELAPPKPKAAVCNPQPPKSLLAVPSVPPEVQFVPSYSRSKLVEENLDNLHYQQKIMLMFVCLLH
jgi:hypothetical protein